MCTTGIRRLPDGGYVLFKNKDFGRTHLDDRIWLDGDLFGVLGMTTWAGDDPIADQYSGFSIGANRHGLLCCDSNVATLADHANYDEMTELALREGTDVASAVDAIRARCAASPVSWGNLVLIDGRSAASLELYGDTVHVVPLDGPSARTNHHVVLGYHEGQEDSATSVSRLASAQRRIEQAATLEDLFALQASHDAGSSGVCNHDDMTTVYGYVLHVSDGRLDLHVVQGHPCTGRRIQLEVPLGDHFGPESAAAFLDAYPSAFSGNHASTV